MIGSILDVLLNVLLNVQAITSNSPSNRSGCAQTINLVRMAIVGAILLKARRGLRLQLRKLTVTREHA